MVRMRMTVGRSSTAELIYSFIEGYQHSAMVTSTHLHRANMNNLPIADQLPGMEVKKTLEFPSGRSRRNIGQSFNTHYPLMPYGEQFRDPYTMDSVYKAHAGSEWRSTTDSSLLPNIHSLSD
jgi:hypothetical protein